MSPILLPSSNFIEIIWLHKKDEFIKEVAKELFEKMVLNEKKVSIILLGSFDKLCFHKLTRSPTWFGRNEEWCLHWT